MHSLKITFLLLSLELYRHFTAKNQNQKLQHIHSTANSMNIIFAQSPRAPRSYGSGLSSSRWMQHTQWVCIASWGIQCFCNKSKLALCSKGRHYLISQGCLIQTQLGEMTCVKVVRALHSTHIPSKTCGNMRDPWRSVSSNSYVPSGYIKRTYCKQSSWVAFMMVRYKVSVIWKGGHLHFSLDCLYF